MIELTPAFKTAIANGGPLKYLIQISDDDGVSWQDLPSGAEAHSPLGDVSGETEVEPFQFVGADCEMTCNNINGFWTNSAKTGKLDTGYAVKFRLKLAPSSITGEWVQLIEGYIDLGSVTNYRTAFTCVFTVRGCLNVLDSVLANYVLADRPATYPHKFGGWLQIVAVDPSYPEGLYELRFDASEGMVSWDNGPGQSINTSSTLYLKGQTGNQISVRNMRSGTDATALPQTSGTISQWIAIKTVGDIKGAYQPSVSLTIARLKTLIYSNVDLDYANVESIPIKRPDANVVNFVPEELFGQSTFTKLSPIHVAGITTTKWLVSFDGGALTGNFILEVEDTTYFKVKSFARTNDMGTSNCIVVGSYKIGDYIYFLCDWGTPRTHTYLNTIATGKWRIFKYQLSTWVQLLSWDGTGNLLYKSWVGYAEDTFYASIMTDATHAKTNSIVVSVPARTIVITPVSVNPYTIGVSMCPAIISLDRFYIVATSILDTTDNKIKVYLHIFDIAAAPGWERAPTLTEIEAENKSEFWRWGPVGMAQNKKTLEYNTTIIESLGVYLLMSPISYIDGSVIKPLSCDKTNLHIMEILPGANQPTMVIGHPINEPPYVSTGQTSYFYMTVLKDNPIGRLVKWTVGVNAGQTKTISAVEYLTDWRMKITMDTPLTYPIGDINIDTFRIYPSLTTVLGASFTYQNIEKDINFIRSGGPSLTNENITQTTGLMVTPNVCSGFGETAQTLFKNVPLGYPLAGDYNSDGTRILIATQDNLQVVDLNQADGVDTTPNQYPEVALADFDDKNLRDALQEVAISANCHLMPSEHNKRLSLIYRGKAANPQFTLANTEYKEGPRATPYFDYDAVEVNDKKAGVFYAGNKQRDISLTTQCTPDAYAQSLAYDILEHIGSGDRTHEIEVVGRVELEPGDEGYLELEDGTTKQAMILGHTTNPETLDRSMIIREF